MGDRANIYLKQNGGKFAGIYLYTHWSGNELPVTLRDALNRGMERWSDEQYLGRIIFDEMVGRTRMELTGYGISTYPCDNNVGYGLLIVDAEAQRVSVAPFPESAADALVEQRSCSFAEYAAMSNKQCREFRSGKSEESDE